MQYSWLAAGLLAAAFFAQMLATAFLAPATPGPGAPRTLRAAEAAPLPSTIRAAEATGTSGWYTLAATGAMAAVAVLGSRQRRRAQRPGQLSGGSYVPVVPSAAGAITTMQGQRGPVFNYNRSLLKSPHRPKKGNLAKDRRKALWLKYSKNLPGRKRNCHRLAKQGVMYTLKCTYRNRRQFKRDRRELWIKRVSNNSKLHGVKYNTFICRMKEKNININRKILSQLGVYDRAVFTNVLETAIPEWKELKEEADNKGKKKEYTVEELDNIAIPYFEATVPELYTDPKIRFNRQVKDWGVEYTIDVGDPEDWRDRLPKMPELANFQLPDHMLNNGRRQMEEIPIEDRMVIPDEKTDEKYAKFMDTVRAAWADEEEKAAAGEKVREKKEGVSRDDWFSEEPQSWF